MNFKQIFITSLFFIIAIKLSFAFLENKQKDKISDLGKDVKTINVKNEKNIRDLESQLRSLIHKKPKIKEKLDSILLVKGFYVSSMNRDSYDFLKVKEIQKEIIRYVAEYFSSGNLMAYEQFIPSVENCIISEDRKHLLLDVSLFQPLKKLNVEVKSKNKQLISSILPFHYKGNTKDLNIEVFNPLTNDTLKYNFND